MPKQPDNKNKSTRHHNRRSPEPGQNHALTLNGRIMVLLLVIGFIAAGCGVLIYKLYTLQIRDAEQYRVQAAEQQLSDTQIPPRAALFIPLTANCWLKAVWCGTLLPTRPSATRIMWRKLARKSVNC